MAACGKPTVNIARVRHARRTKEAAMPIFITHGRDTSSAVKCMVEHSQDRAKAVADLFGHAGGKLLAFYLTFGEYDWLSVAEMPDAGTNLAVLLAGISKETVSEVKTTLAVTPEAFRQACASAATSSCRRMKGPSPNATAPARVPGGRPTDPSCR
jgi:uncharacterized protein with GYD domain